MVEVPLVYIMMLTCARFQCCFDKCVCAPHIYIFLLQHTSDHLDISTWLVSHLHQKQDTCITYTNHPGPLKFMSYIAVALLVVSSGIPLLFVYGKKLRSLTSGKVKKARKGGSKWED